MTVVDETRYFEPKGLPNLGTFQDGGVRANCPVRTALRESALIWPSGARPDLVVSIGTGFARPQLSEDSSTRFFDRGFIGRAVRTFLYSPAVDGNQGWQDALDSIPEDLKADIFRLDRPLPGVLPALDDVGRIEELNDFNYDIPEELSRAIVATSFFFELDGEPLFSDGVFHCQGSILCCKQDLAAVLSVTQKNIPNARFRTLSGSNLGRVDEHDGCGSCGYYRKRVVFGVSCIQEEIRLGIESHSKFRKIGGFPTSIQSLLRDQQADAVFGRADHCTDRWPPSRLCYCAVGSKRRGESGESGQRTRKRTR